MVEVGGRPILWHVMKIYDHYGFHRFIVPVGYLGHMIKEYFLSYAHRHVDFTVDTGSGALHRLDEPPEALGGHRRRYRPETMTGGRIKRLSELPTWSIPGDLRRRRRRRPDR